MSANAEAGAMYSLTTSNGSNIINEIASVKPTWESNQTLFEVYKGTTESGIAATCKKSVINKTNTIYYCYTQDNQNYHRFDPDDVSNLPLGTYTVWAIACDGHIAVRSATSVELRIKDYTVTLLGTDYGTYKVTCGEQEITVSNQTRTITDVAAGTQLTITDIQPDAGYDKMMIYSTDGGETYTEFGQEKKLTVTSDVTIAEDFRTTEDRDIYLKVTAKPYEYWCNNSNDQEDAPGIVYVHRLNQKEKLYNPLTYRIKFDLFAETNSYNIYKVTIPKGNNSFCIYPSKNHTDATKQSKIFRIPIASSTISCYELYNEEVKIENNIPSTNGQWRDEITVTIKKVADHYDSDGYGHITVQYNNTKYTSKSNEDVTFTTPIGSTITIVESQHEHPETYNGDLIYTDEEGSEHYLNNPVNYPITVWGDIEITENFVVRKEATDRDITPNAGVFVFLRIPKRLDQGNVEGDWNYGQPEDLTRHDGYPIDKFANFVYLKMDVKRGHEVIGSKPEDLGCADAGQEAGHFLMDTAHIQDDQFNTYYCIITDSCWHTVKFERKHADSDAGQGQITCTDIQRFPGGKNNCFTITERKSDGAFTGTWGEAPTCTVTLGYCEFGRYGVVYDGKTYYSKDRSDVVIENVPFGTELQILLPREPASDKYNGNLTYEITENDKKEKRDLTTSTYTVTQDVTIDDNFVTKIDITAYLGIPTALTDWTKNGNQNIDNHSMQELAVYIWKTDSYDKGFSMEETERGIYLDTIDGIAYYQFTITAGCNDFQFQLKDLKNAEEGNNGKNSGYTYRKSQWHRFQIPLTDVNCFVLDVNNYGSDNSKEYTGYWTRLPQQKEGDYRLRYIEQTLTLVDGHPHTEEVYSHCSDIIKANDPEEKRTLYSLHIFNEMDEEKTYGGEIIQGLNNPAIVVEKWDGSQWVEQMRHMVFGPLRGDFSLAAMPGRRNESPIDPYDNGIENIKHDLKNIEAYSNSGTSFYIGKDNPEETDYKRYIENWGNDNCSGVWNFVVNRDDAGNINTQDPLLLEKTHRYDGTYYIRTIGTIGGWDNYTIPENHMTRTNISKTNSNFSHYFCKWLTKNVNVRYVIANDYNLAISDDLKADKTTLMGKPIGDNDKIVADDEELPTNVNVRFSWNEKTNFLHRAYLSGSTHVQDRFLVLGGSGDGKLYNKDGNDLKAGEDTGSDPRYGLNANEEIFQDISNWIYYTDVQMIPLAKVKLTALIKYKKDEQDKRIEQYFVGTSDEWNNTLLQGTSDEKYLIRVLYDFKTNQMISAYVPDRKETEDIGHIKTNLMLIREENNTETIHQLTFNTNHMEEIDQQAYGVLEFTHKTLREGSYNELSRRLYWISFPFDVRIEDAFGSLKYGTHWIIQTYNGKKRADNGLYYESESNWINNFNPNDVYNYDATEEEDKSRGILRNGAGYVVALNLKNIRRDFDLTTDSRMAIYFPSKEFIKKEIVKKGSVTIDVPAHACTKPGRDIYDSHWNVIGVPSYKSAGANFNHPILAKNDVKYYYSWLGEHDKYEPVSQSEVNFNTLFSYMVQYGGELYWENIVQEDWSTNNIAARKDVDNQKEYNLRLEVQKNGTELDRTFVKLQEDDVTALFDFNYDLCKITNAGANIYSFTSDATPIKVAGNVLPLTQDIVIPVGVVIDQAGDYTFSMPDGTAGIEVQLIDYQTNEKTNLLFGDYTINLPKGTFDNRFALLINPDKTATSVDNIGAEAEGVKKYIIDGQLYLQQGSALYDAQGHTVR